MIDYTTCGEVIRGSAWPPAGDYLSVVLTKASGWGGAATWKWRLLLSREQLGGIADLGLDAASVTIAGTDITLRFQATGAQTATLPGRGAMVFNVGIRSIAGAVTSYYDAAQGTANVRDYVGEG